MADVSESVQNLLDKVTPAKRRRDAETLLELMARATGESPQVYYGTGIGYGHTTTSTRAAAKVPQQQVSHHAREPPLSIWWTVLAGTRSSSSS